MPGPVIDSAHPVVKNAMVLAAGLGTRMRPLTDRKPKPLVEVLGKALIDHVLDRLLQAGIETAVVNIHHMADLIEAHVRERTRPRLVISDERALLLGTGGGIKQALQWLGPDPFVLANSDSIWIESAVPNLKRLMDAFDATRMQALLLLAPSITAIGYQGQGDYSMDADGRIRRRGARAAVPFVYTGVAVLDPRMFDGAGNGVFALPPLFDRAQAEGRLCGIALDGTWMHVGSPEALAAAEGAIRRAAR